MNDRVVIPQTDERQHLASMILRKISGIAQSAARGHNVGMTILGVDAIVMMMMMMMKVNVW